MHWHLDALVSPGWKEKEWVVSTQIRWGTLHYINYMLLSQGMLRSKECKPDLMVKNLGEKEKSCTKLMNRLLWAY